MIFVTGPMFAGKREYIRNALKMDEEAFAACAVWDVQKRVLLPENSKAQDQALKPGDPDVSVHSVSSEGSDALEQTSVAEFPVEKEQTCSSEDFEKNTVITDFEELRALADSLAKKKIVIAAEVGGGIVPADPGERAAREAAGRLACLLAARADVVIRVCCGLPQVLKGEWPLCQ